MEFTLPLMLLLVAAWAIREGRSVTFFHVGPKPPKNKQTRPRRASARELAGRNRPRLEHGRPDHKDRSAA